LTRADFGPYPPCSPGVLRRHCDRARRGRHGALLRIVGVDESDGAAGDISWKSPVGRALLGKQAGDTVTIRLETSVRELTIAVIAYPKG
jgi:transcription elongation GreA/GreB family factor